MTLIARNPETGAFGIAGAKRFFAVGSLCPHALDVVRAARNPSPHQPNYGARGLRMFREDTPLTVG